MYVQCFAIERFKQKFQLKIADFLKEKEVEFQLNYPKHFPCNRKDEI